MLQWLTMLATAQPFTWPVKARAVAYIQVGDLVEMLFHNKASAFAACEFCRTANHKCAARCRICGSMLPERGDEDRRDPVMPSARDTSLMSEARSLANALLLVLVPALLLFGGLAGWQLLHSNAWITHDGSSHLDRASCKAGSRQPGPANGQGRRRRRECIKGNRSHRSCSLRREESPPSPQSTRLAHGNAGSARRSPSVSAPAQKAALNGSRRTMLTSRHQEQHPLSACNEGNFFTRAA